MQETVTKPATKALLIYPQFNAPSFWNYRASCELLGARYPTAPLGLMTVAAMLPADWDVCLIDCNTQSLDLADIDRADIIMTGGMLPQQCALLQIIDLCHSRGKPVVVGGPDVTSSPQIYDRADFQIRGEAESVMPAFIAAWNSGARGGVFEGEKFQADVTTTPIPRFDLIRFQDYLYIGVQFPAVVLSIASFATLSSFTGVCPAQRQYLRCSPNSTPYIAWGFVDTWIFQTTT